jgi:hypothetical protein
MARSLPSTQDVTILMRYIPPNPNLSTIVLILEQYQAGFGNAYVFKTYI